MSLQTYMMPGNRLGACDRVIGGTIAGIALPARPVTVWQAVYRNLMDAAPTMVAGCAASLCTLEPPAPVHQTARTPPLTDVILSCAGMCTAPHTPPRCRLTARIGGRLLWNLGDLVAVV